MPNIIKIHCFELYVEIPCSEKSAKSETSNSGLRFLRFFEMPLQKNVKSRVFWILKKKRKKRIVELCGQIRTVVLTNKNRPDK